MLYIMYSTQLLHYIMYNVCMMRWAELRGFLIVIVNEVGREVGILQIWVQQCGGVQGSSQLQCKWSSSWFIRHFPFEEDGVRTTEGLSE